MRLAVIGLGHIGRRRLRLLREMGQDDVVVYDSDPRRCVEVAAEFECVACAGWIEVWQYRPEAAFICTLPDSHATLASTFLSRGCHVFIEKPLEIIIGHAEWLVDSAAKYPDRIAMVSCNMRFHPGPAQLKAWLDEGRIGEPLWARFETASWLPDWHPGEDYVASYSARVGATLDCGSHELDLALWMLGPATLAGAATRKADVLGLECDGMAEMLLRHESGVLSTVHASFMENQYHRSVEVIGTKGRASWSWEGHFAAVSLDGGVAKPENWRHIVNDIDAMYRAEMAHFLDCAERGVPTCNPIGQAAETLRILLEAKHG